MVQSRSNPADVIRQIMVLASVIVTIVFNGLSQSIPIGGQTSADVSNTYSTYFTPANYAFAIWGLIYLLLLSFGIYQALPAQRANPTARRIGWLFVLSCVLNCLWITFFQYDLIVVSVIVIIALLLTLLVIYTRLDAGRGTASIAERLFLHLPFSVYLGWLSVATIANVSVLGISQNWGNLLGIAAPTWAAIMLGVATVIGVAVVIARRDFAYAGVFVWAFLAIINKQSEMSVVTTAWAGVLILLVISSISFMLNRRNPQSFVPRRA